MLKVWPVDMNAKSDVEYIMDELRLNPYQRMAVLSRRRDSEAVPVRRGPRATSSSRLARSA